MKLRKSSHQKNIVFQLDDYAQKVAVSAVSFEANIPYSDAESFSISGLETLSLPVCENKEKFIKEINKSDWIFVSLKDDKFQVESTTGLLGPTPAGIYKSAVVDKQMVLIKDGSDEFRLFDHIQLNWAVGGKALFFRGGRSIDWSGDLRLLGSYTDSRLLQSHSLLLGNDTTTSSAKRLSAKTTAGLVTSVRAKVENEECFFGEYGRLFYPALAQGDSIVISCIGKNNGLFMNSCFIGFVDPVYSTKKEDIFNSCSCGFILRANKIYKQRKIQIVADIPLDVKAIRVQLAANGSCEFHAIKKDETQILCFTGPILSATAKFCVADNAQTTPVLAIPTFFQKRHRDEFARLSPSSERQWRSVV